MDEQREKKREGFDPTKEAFFSDLNDMQEEIMTEAYELVKHALSLLETYYYDDAIEIMRQAIGLYEQVNRKQEVDALYSKISEIQLLKEKRFREQEFEIEVEEEEISQESEIVEDKKKKLEILISEAGELIENHQFDKALDKYDETDLLYQQLNDTHGQEQLNKMIEECYNKKADYLRQLKVPEISSEDTKADKLILFKETKLKESQISSQAFELVGKASELAKGYLFDEALKLYHESVALFEEINWMNEAKNIKKIIDELQKQKVRVEETAEQSRLERETVRLNTLRKEEKIIEQSKNIEEMQVQAKTLRLKELSEKKQEEDDFRLEISNKVDFAEKLVREYELGMKKAIKQGSILAQSVYPEVITIYESIKEMVSQRGWNDQVTIYEKQIKFYKNKLQQDFKLRDIEAKKGEKQKIYEDSLKVTKKEEEKSFLPTLEDVRSLEQQEQESRMSIDNLINSAEKMAREYDIAFKKAIKKGNLAIKSKYPEILDLYTQARNYVSQKGWIEEAAVYSTHIKKYTDLYNNELNVREIEAKKIEKDREFETMHIIQTSDAMTDIKIQEIKALEEDRIKEEESLEFRKQIDSMVKTAEKMAREYDIAFKKAIKKGNLGIESEYPHIIELYRKVQSLVNEKNLDDEVAIYSTHIKKYTELYNKELKVREIEAKKIEKDREFETMHIIQTSDAITDIKIQKIKTLEEGQIKQEEALEIRKLIDSMVKSAEKMAREYDIAFKKAIKKGNLEIESEYPHIIELYIKVQSLAKEKNLVDEVAIYSTHIKKYTDLYNNELNIREIEAKKLEKDREFETMHIIQTSDAMTDIKIQKIKTLEEDRIKEEEALEFRKQIDSMVNSAEKMAREYDIAFKKAIKKGNLDIKSKYPGILELYTQARTFVSQKGWIEEATIYSAHIKKYTALYKNELKIREIEAKKLEKDKEFEELKKINKEDSAYGFQLEKLKFIEEKQKTQKEDEKFEKDIDNIINSTVKEAREYEMAIKRGQFEKDCPFLKISETYEEIYKQVYKRGWKEEAELYKKQVILFREKSEKDNRLRKLELEKIEKQKVYEESFKVSSDEKTSNIQKLQELEGKRNEKDIQLDKAMNLINEAENAVRSYELSIKKDVILIKSPYDDAILKYEQAKKIFKDIEWIDESNRLIATIRFYKEKKVRDDNLRDLEMQKLENEKNKTIKQDQRFSKTANLQEMRALKFETSKKEKDSEAETILNGINEAEKIAKNYELEIMKGNLNNECPYEQIIDKYREAKLKFEQIGWLEQAAQIVNSISHYQEKLISDKNLRNLEKQKLQKEGEELQKLKVETKLAREAEAELMKQKVQAIELREEKVRKYESKKDQAFDLMDLAKRELQLNKFETAIKYYNESEKIFSEINWKEGIQMVRGSIKAIKKKKEKLEYERKLKIQQEQEKLAYIEQLDEKISKAHELKKWQENQKRQELLVIQRQKEQERSISEQAYKFLEIGTELKDKKKFDEAHEKYIMARDLFKKLEWTHEVSRINNDLLFILKREMKQTEKLKALKRIKIDKEQEIEDLLKEAETKRGEQEIIKKEEKRKKREEFVNEEWERAGTIIKDLKYNEAIVALKKVGKKLKKMGKDKLLKQVLHQIETLISASQVPIITTSELERGENMEKFEASYRGLDSAQISLSKNQHRRAISELNEVKFNLQDTLVGISFIPLVEDTINSLKSEVDGKSSISTKAKTQEIEIEEPAKKEEDLRTQISTRRAERKKRIQELLEKNK